MDPDPSGLSFPIQLLILLALTAINAFFSAAEMALVSLNKTRMKLLAENIGDGDARAEKVLNLLEEPNTFLSTIQVVLTLASLLSSAFASYNLSDGLVARLAQVGIVMNPQGAIILITLVLSYFVLVFGELLPKRVALIYSERIALFSITPLLAISRLLRPFIRFLSFSVNLLMRVFKHKSSDEDREYYQEEILSLLEAGQEQGNIDESGKEMIHSIFEFSDALAYEIMTARPDVYMININAPLSEYLDELLEERYTRVPVYNKDSDDIIGVLYMKDFIIEARKKGFEHIDLAAILKKPFFVPESKKISDLLRELQFSKMQMAILIDEYGGFSGIVTVEDILEEIVGNIEDEYEDDEPKMEEVEPGHYVVDGLFDLEDLSEAIQRKIESENHETVGGFVMDLMGEVPDEETDIGRELIFGDCSFRILSVKDRRIEKIDLTVKEAAEEDGEKPSRDEEE